MKKPWVHIAGIGIFHMVLYVYLVPFVIYPKLGNLGLTLSIALAVVISLVVLGTLVRGRNRANKGDKNDRD